MQAARGDKTQIQVPMPGGETKTVELEIPAGARSQSSAACELCWMSWVGFSMLRHSGCRNTRDSGVQ